ncbi:6,7-dimethyl-8-ribityllumazine synthase [Accumulibacter sp.]|uniref:6,7-dimethyl-8-ribityllumazine synthase n=1 Tax=Accumulibacter sp. TaxID=2053492 RepID=UPI0025FD1DDD|nr:6,7-dimethyl-8-ribityllumazine synthase [Accumulibacter sp.]MCM8593841.1 6,7-dimethyl-8-ribityllumazine synthase [Accumulibacter sp.]MCM8626117.1 6,7-dimethyl-8-ribityllumazine synthase [Accumulibacter sp.]MDS4047982.1 6,7-dimethyl-8-ribityllumazine synthase [Accumulibacter sp.]
MAARRTSGDDRPPARRAQDIFEFEPSLSGEGLAVGVVMSRFNQDIGEGLLSACTDELRRLGVARQSIAIATVPGALEIPLTLQGMAQSGRFQALIALGAVIRGETYHFEIVANDSCRALMDVQMRFGVPVANGILTCEDDDQALARMHQKGLDCARAAVEMANLLGRLRELR